VEDLQPEFKYVIIPRGELLIRSYGLRICPFSDFLSTELPGLS
jgi:hypothetical protein